VSDLDRDGIDDVVVASSSSATGAVSNWYVDSDDDGVPESSMELQCSPGGTSSKAIQTKGSGAIASVRSSTPLAADSGATLVLDYDDDGDGVSTFRLVDRAEPVLVSSTMEADTDDDGLGDNIIESKVTPTMCSHSITTKGTGAQAGRIFLDGSRSQDDGVIKNFLWQQVSGPGGFVTEREVSMDIDSGGSSMSISNADGTRGQITARSGMSGSTTATIRMATSVDSGVVDYLDYDDDGDGIAEHTVRVTARDAYGNTMVSSDSDDDGVSDFSIESRCDPTKSTLKVDGDLTVGTGSLEFTVGNTAPELRVTQDGTDRCVVRSDSGVQLFDDLGAKTVHLSTGGTVTVSGSLSLGSVASSHFIDVQGGAYCDGTDWVNASDAASKENFRAVDGADLLKQIADLEISRWNYKGQDNVEHIGPTAQDFQAAFGVGANDKSISTIDPSGIALAAIKELQRQNQELAGQNDALRGELESLRREVRALAATR